MAEWIAPIYDRTQEDVEFAITQIAKWITADITGHRITAYDLKGCLNTSDLSRIEGNVAYLAEKLSGYGYSISVTTKDWSRSDMPTERDVARITNNVAELIASYYKPVGATSVPTQMMLYSEINDIERNLYLIERLLDSMVRSFKLSNDFQSGGTVFLPRSREVSQSDRRVDIVNGVANVISPYAVANVIDDVLYVTSTEDSSEIKDNILYVK